MSLVRRDVRNTALAVATVLGVYLSGFALLGLGLTGWLFAVPVFSCPIVILAWWKSSLAAILWVAEMALFVGAQIALAWPEVTFIAKNGTHLSVYVIVGVILIAVAVFDRIDPSSVLSANN